MRRSVALLGLSLVTLLGSAAWLEPFAGAQTLQQAGGILNIRINYQDSPTVPPAGYFRDYGEPFGPRGINRDDQGCGLQYGWVTPGTNTPLDLGGNGRNRNRNAGEAIEPDLRLATFMHIQGTPTKNITGAWEIALPNGSYDVTVAVGDPTQVDSVHQINVEGQPTVSAFQPTTANRYAVQSRVVTVGDGRLTIDANGGTNTKINYVDILTAGVDKTRPFVTGTSPADCKIDVARDVFVAADVNLPNVGAGVDTKTLTAQTVRLFRTSDGAAVPANRNTSGGGDVILIQPTQLLDANTQYTFQVNGVRDTSGKEFLPYTSTFTTGTAGAPSQSGISFTKVLLDNARGKPFATVTIGPDGKLYASTLLGEIVRFSINADGTLGAPQTIRSLVDKEGSSRLLVGMAFDPKSTASNPILWVSHGVAVLTSAPDWTSKITRLSGANLENVQDYVVNLPRAVRDHVTESVVFGPDGALYVPQGSSSGMGAPDTAWGDRPERLLTAAILRIDLGKISNPPLDVKTEEGGTYNPFAANAPVTIYATGVRNAFDLVWHSNGKLYAPTNGAGSDGNTPSTPDTLPPSCQNRIDDDENGNYTGPRVVGPINVRRAQSDFLFRIEKGGYYGHPNPLRCEWVMNGGNPTSGPDPAQEPEYPVGTQPDRNWRGFAYDFGQHYSPNGAIEYKSNAFNGALRGKLLVARYSGGKDIIVLTPGGPNQDIVQVDTGLQGMTGFQDPLDIIENPANGNLYVTELAGQQITLLKPNVAPPGTPPPSNLPNKRYLPRINTGASAQSSLAVPGGDPAGIGSAAPMLVIGVPLLRRLQPRRRWLQRGVLVGTLVAAPFAAWGGVTAQAAGPALRLENLDGAPFPDRLVFSRIQQNPGTTPEGAPITYGVHDTATLRIGNSGTAALTVSRLDVAGPWQRVGGPGLPATIQPSQAIDVTLRFTASDLGPTSSGLHTGTLTIASNDTATPTKTVALAGFWQNVSEGGQEPTLGRIVTAFGYESFIVNPGEQLFNKGQVSPVGEEVLSPYWLRADANQPVGVLQLAAYHGNYKGEKSTIYWHAQGSNSTSPIVTHAASYGQSLLPPRDGTTNQVAAASFTPTASIFGFKVDNEWSDPTKNNQTVDRNNGCPEDRQCGHRLRFWPLRDRAGALVANTYLMAMDYSGINYDYQDNVYLISNIRPETPPTSQPVLRDGLYRLNAGGAGYIDRNGFVWTSDRGYFAPSSAPDEAGNLDPDVRDTQDDPIFQSYRGNTGSLPRVLTYTLPVEGLDRVDLRLYFAERFGGNNAPGKRVFDILANGKPLSNSDPTLDGEDFDIYAAAGAVNTAKVVTYFNVPVVNGALKLEFRASADYPAVNGVEVLCRGTCPAQTTPPPSPSPSPGPTPPPANLTRRGWIAVVIR